MSEPHHDPPTPEEQRLYLEQLVRDRTHEASERLHQSLERLALLGEFRDDATGHHAERVGEIAARIARTLGWDDQRVELIRRAAPLHDLGKVGVPDAVLLKPGPLDDDEMTAMMAHTTIGHHILTGSRVRQLQMAATIALSHHERWDGGGYPAGLAGDDIPLPARVVTVADVYDSLTHARVYKPAWSQVEALAEITAQSGTHFDPVVVRAFMDL